MTAPLENRQLARQNAHLRFVKSVPKIRSHSHLRFLIRCYIFNAIRKAAGSVEEHSDPDRTVS